MIECTDSVDNGLRQFRLDQTKGEALRLAQAFLDVPEYHDEGRLPAGNDPQGNPVLGPLAGIYASPFLHGFTRPGQIYEQGSRGTLAGIVVVQQQNGEEMPATYTALGLAFGLNCVWLYVDPPAQGVRSQTHEYLAYLKHLKYHAWVSQATGDPVKCDRTATMSSELPVTAVQVLDYGVDSAYLPAARFDIGTTGKLVLGLRCLNAFCEIGVESPQFVRLPNGVTRTAAGFRAIPPVRPERIGKRSSIKAWYDEQKLAIRDRQLYWRPSTVQAVITAEPAAATLDSVDYTNKWVRVATITISGELQDTSKYARWGFRPGSNFLEFQFADTAQRNKWRARIVHPDSSFKMWHYMERTVHFDVSVPPIVRFRWTGIDDGVWAPCGNACCKAADGT
jgi:hypothetical protein